jgi:hypothetical protein
MMGTGGEVRAWATRRFDMATTITVAGSGTRDRVAYQRPQCVHAAALQFRLEHGDLTWVPSQPQSASLWSVFALAA